LNAPGDIFRTNKIKGVTELLEGNLKLASEELTVRS
jgi:hypothetical protein